MKLTLEIEEKGLKAYEQARAFERMSPFYLPLGYAVLVLIPVLSSVGLWSIGHVTMAVFCFGAAVLFALGAVIYGRRLKVRYAENVRLLADLKKEYGNQLPWVQVEAQMAMIEQLQREEKAG
jgi:hypothetical protein